MLSTVKTKAVTLAILAALAAGATATAASALASSSHHPLTQTSAASPAWNHLPTDEQGGKSEIIKRAVQFIKNNWPAIWKTLVDATRSGRQTFQQVWNDLPTWVKAVITWGIDPVDIYNWIHDHLLS
ncbi:hypothetical protein AQI88_26925 [Streptomyces cellostaticus]|uniref:Secreted protein n=1 Tax=Streptomyces cellostaticus TaxID=67285 RepID=A0A101NHY3_9ACTN|nr:hypothetical protein [Streptomyces cellostaticus]KUM93409.1 hypothetical protein AQI88_26925 [Streptomyces cellostaticus]GHI02241.1 hypothetical protein Scel_05620 [Streptomyces cellostaticus]